MTARRTYLDYNASAPLRPEARLAMAQALELVGNPSSVHAEGRRSRAVIETARLAVAELVGARVADVVFTSGATEANATVLAGGWETIFLSALEHDSVRGPALRSGARIVDLPVTGHGTIDVAKAAALIAETGCRATARDLLCVQLANNETGVVQPVAELASVARAQGVRIHCDAVQAPGRLRVDCAALGVDFLVMSSHKIGGPKGAGALVIVDGAALASLIAGGGQERGRRAGTENVAAIAGFGAAARLARSDLQSIDRIKGLRDGLEAKLRALSPGAVVIGQAAPRLPNTTCLALPGVSSETAVIRLDLAGVAVSAGAACSSGKVGASAALAAMGLAPELTRSALRLSLGAGSTTEDVSVFLTAWIRVAAAHPRAA